LNNGGFLAHLTDWAIEMRQKPETSKDAADKLVKSIRRKTSRFALNWVLPHFV